MAQRNIIYASLSAMALCAFVALGCSEDAPGSSSSSAGGSYGGAAGSPQGDGGSEIGGTGGSSAGGSSSIGGSYGGAAGSPQGGSAGTGGSGGILFGCTPDDLSGCDPLANPDCASLTCNEGECGIEFTPDGIMLPEDKQTAGDCQELVCDGAGGTKSVPIQDPSDDGKVCTLDDCSNGNPVHNPIPPGLPCAENGGKMCDGAGNCVECVMDLDCVNWTCKQGKCVAATCDDLIKNNAETDVDCGGGTCAECDDGKLCVVADDCQSGYCTNGVCGYYYGCLPDDLSSCDPPVNPDCATATCINGECGWVFQPDGTVLPQGKQQPGDCQEFVCDGAGGIKSVPADDPSNDGNQCTLDSCSNGNPVHNPIPPGLPCAENGGKMCDGAGNCVECNADADCQNGSVCQQNKCVVNACPPWQPGPGLTCGAWTDEQVGNLGFDLLYDFWASGPNDMFVVGGSYNFGKIMHSDGNGWVEQPTPTTRFLQDIIGFAPNDVYAVGRGPMPAYGGVLLHYDGQSWTKVPGTPNVGKGAFRALWGTSGSNLYVLAWQDPNQFQMKNSVWHWNGQVWTEMPLPKPLLPEDNMNDIWGSSNSDIWVVGQLVANPYASIIYRYDGISWSYEIPQGVTSLWQVTGSGKCDIIASGSDGAKKQAVFLRYDGASWTKIAGPVNGGGLAAWTGDVNKALLIATLDPTAGNSFGLDNGQHGFNWTIPQWPAMLRGVNHVPGTSTLYVVGDGWGGGPTIKHATCN